MPAQTTQGRDSAAEMLANLSAGKTLTCWRRDDPLLEVALQLQQDGHPIVMRVVQMDEQSSRIDVTWEATGVPDPAPYGANLPRPPAEGVWFFTSRESNEYARAIYAALDAANARVAELVAERDTWLAMWQELVAVVHAVVHKDTSNGAQEAIELLLDSLDGRGLLPPDYPELPTEEAA